jgi:hypothetical protein
MVLACLPTLPAVFRLGCASVPPGSFVRSFCCRSVGMSPTRPWGLCKVCRLRLDSSHRPNRMRVPACAEHRAAERVYERERDEQTDEKAG